MITTCSWLNAPHIFIMNFHNLVLWLYSNWLFFEDSGFVSSVVESAGFETSKTWIKTLAPVHNGDDTLIKFFNISET